MAQKWYLYPKTHGYITDYEGPGTDTPHFAEDIGTPFHTPLTAILPGTVKTADYQDWGGEIFIQPDDKRYPEYYFYHPDEVDVHTGQHVQSGQVIGLSGGENPGFPGAEHPAKPEWSSGPHTHVGWFERWQQTPVGTRPYGHNPDDLLQIAKSGSGGVPGNVPGSIYDAVEPIAQQYHVPDPLWETVAYVESGFNSQALGDNGTSYGIFQLHIGGQFPSKYLDNPTALDDPSLNAQYAMPAIARAWQSLQPTFDASSSEWWQRFAAQSGHPGGTPGETTTDNEATKLQASYSRFANSSAPFSQTDTTCEPPAGLQALNPAAWVSYWQCSAQNAVSGSVTSVEAGIASWIGSTIGGFAMRLGVGIAGLALIWIGLNEIAAGINTPASSPAPEEKPQEESPSEEPEEEKPAPKKKPASAAKKASAKMAETAVVA